VFDIPKGSMKFTFNYDSSLEAEAKCILVYSKRVIVLQSFKHSSPFDDLFQEHCAYSFIHW
jgi:hypothetical protein